MSKAKTVLTIVCIVVLQSHFNTSARGGLIVYDDRDDFNMQGTIVHNSNFADLATDTPFFQAIDGPFTRGDVTYDPSGSDDYVVIGTSSSLNPVQNLIAHDQYTPLTGAIQNGPYNMLGFDAGSLLDNVVNNPVKFAITTNLATYDYNFTLPLANSSLEFFGFVTDIASEYFQSFTLSTDYEEGSESGPGITNVTLGNTPEAVPEPSTFLVLGVASIGVAVFSRRRRRQPLA